MTKFPEKFFLNLNKIKDYWILRKEEEEIIIGTNIVVNVHTEIKQTFSTYSRNIKTTLPIFFLLTTLDKEKGLKEEFTKRNFFVKKIEKTLLNESAENIKEQLDLFVKENFNVI